LRPAPIPRADPRLKVTFVKDEVRSGLAAEEDDDEDRSKAEATSIELRVLYNWSVRSGDLQTSHILLQSDLRASLSFVSTSSPK
jgi:hypothetical protein